MVDRHFDDTLLLAPAAEYAGDLVQQQLCGQRQPGGDSSCGIHAEFVQEAA